MTVLLLAVLTPLAAQHSEFYPFSYTYSAKALGGQLISTHQLSADSNAYHTFLIKRKPTWSDDAEVVQVWQRTRRRQWQGSSLGGASLHAAVPISATSIVAIVQRAEQLILAEIDTALRVLRETDFEQEYAIFPNSRFSLCYDAPGGSGMALVNHELFNFRTSDSALTVVKQTAYPVEDVTALMAPDTTWPAFAYLRVEGMQHRLMFLNGDGVELRQQEVHFGKPVYLRPVNGRAVAALNAAGDVTKLMIVPADSNYSPSSSVVFGKWFTIVFGDEDSRSYHLRYVEFNERYLWRHLQIPKISGSPVAETIDEFPLSLLEPAGVVKLADGAGVIFRNGLANFSEDGRLLSVDILKLNLESDEPVRLNKVGGSLLATQANKSWIFERRSNSFWWLNRLFRDLWLYLLMAVIVVGFAFLARQSYQRQRILRTLFEMPEADPFVVLDKEGRLRSLNDSARHLLQLPRTVPLGRVFQFYCAGLNAEGMMTLVDEALRFRQQLARRITFEVQDRSHDYLFSAIPIRGFLGNRGGLLLTGRDITEELEKKRLNNWAQLAHDMKTNLSIIKLNAETISETSHDPAASIGRRILFQVNLLINRVRDLVTIGSSDSLDKVMIDAVALCHEVREEFNESLFANVELKVQARHILLSCDKAKLSRALRNAVENGIRSLHGQKGQVEISSWHDQNYVYFQVRDSGAGMDDETLGNMLKPFFTKYKTQGGTGMGTMIMQHVMELHGGEMEVESHKGSGTAVRFKLPNIGTQTVAERRAAETQTS